MLQKYERPIFFPSEILFSSAKVSLESRLKSLTHQAPVMVFMKVSDMIILQDIWYYPNWNGPFLGRPISAKMWLFKAAYADSPGNQGSTDSPFFLFTFPEMKS